MLCRPTIRQENFSWTGVLYPSRYTLGAVQPAIHRLPTTPWVHPTSHLVYRVPHSVYSVSDSSLLGSVLRAGSGQGYFGTSALVFLLVFRRSEILQLPTSVLVDRTKIGCHSGISHSEPVWESSAAQRPLSVVKSQNCSLSGT